ncbi:MauE/DoxX family redox-associated membrane protein [Streptomyces sp. NPDC058401]|uniref:MauE/DoxX family redox-associated membrane protein n=1 Tax=Streptomyces sp. NPDC058401 TaxID=3346480 RepID=UPI00364FCDCF
MHYLSIGTRFLIGVVFLISFCSKAKPAAFGEFADSLRDMRLVPARRVRPVAAAVVAAEAATVLLVSVPAAGGAAFTIAAALLAVFTGAIALTVRRGAATPCRCFGASKAPLGVRHIVRNLALAACAVFGAVTTLMPPGRAAVGGTLVAAAAGTLAGVLVTVLDDLYGLFLSTTTQPVSPVKETGHGLSDRRSRVRGGTVFPGSDPHAGRGQTTARAQ